MGERRCSRCGEDQRLCDCNATPGIDLGRYQTLPEPLRRDFDLWMQREGLTGERIVSFRLLEGAIDAVRLRQDEQGLVYVEPGTDCAVTETVVFPIATAPPREALSHV
jgi:hypothetical protein